MLAAAAQQQLLLLLLLSLVVLWCLWLQRQWSSGNCSGLLGSEIYCCAQKVL
jgi:hypothetical protein